MRAPSLSVQRVHGIAQKIDEHLLDEVGVGRDLERLGIDFSAQRDAFSLAFRLHERHNAVEEFGDWTDLKVRAGYPRELAIGVHKVLQAFAAGLYGLKGGVHVCHGLGIERRRASGIGKMAAHG